MAGDIVALVSVGAHPVSLRPRLAELDARALGVALAQGPERAVTALHAGPLAAAEPLRACVGMGASRVLVLDLPPEADPLPALLAHLEATRPRMMFFGACAETGECSGMLPFYVAERLGCGLVTDLVAFTLTGAVASLVQAMPGGRRRMFEAAVPLVATVGRSASPPRLGALARALRARIEHVPGQPAQRDDRRDWATRPGKARPRRLGPSGAVAGAADRREMVQPDPVAAADAILDLLERESLLRPAGTAMGETR